MAAPTAGLAAGAAAPPTPTAGIATPVTAQEHPPLLDLLRGTDGAQVAEFRAFLRQDCGDEHLAFFLDVERFRAEARAAARASLADAMWRQFAAPDAPRPVALSTDQRAAIQRGLQRAAVDLFDEAQLAVLRCLERDAYSRFLQAEAARAQQLALALAAAGAPLVALPADGGLGRNVSKASLVVRTQAGQLLKSQAAYQGFLMKRGHRYQSWHRRWFMLSGALLGYFEDEFTRVPKGVLRLDTVEEVREAGETELGRRFGIALPLSAGRVLYLQASNPRCQARWVEQLRTMVGLARVARGRLSVQVEL